MDILLDAPMLLHRTAEGGLLLEAATSGNRVRLQFTADAAVLLRDLLAALPREDDPSD